MTQLLSTLLKWACPLMALALPGVIAFGLMVPWPAAQTALGPTTARSAVLVGWSYRVRSNGTDTHERREQTYAVMPTARTVTVIQENGKVRTEEDAHGLWSLLATYALACLGTWWFWFRGWPVQRG